MIPTMTKPEDEDIKIETPVKVLFTKDEFKAIAEDSIICIEFTKVSDNTTRTMNCTLREDLLPKLNITGMVAESNNTRKDNDQVMVVWDLDKKGWRSFRLDSLKSYYIMG